MSNRRTNVMVHIGPNASDADVRRVEDVLRSEPGIRSIQASTRVGRLVFVEYDADAINSLTILERVRREGADGRLIGM